MSLNVHPTRSPREMYDIAPDYLDGEDDERMKDEEREADLIDSAYERHRDSLAWATDKIMEAGDAEHK